MGLLEDISSSPKPWQDVGTEDLTEIEDMFFFTWGFNFDLAKINGGVNEEKTVM